MRKYVFVHGLPVAWNAGLENAGPTSRGWKMTDLENDEPNSSINQKSYYMYVM